MLSLDGHVDDQPIDIAEQIARGKMLTLLQSIDFSLC